MRRTCARSSGGHLPALSPARGAPESRSYCYLQYFLTLCEPFFLLPLISGCYLQYFATPERSRLHAVSLMPDLVAICNTLPRRECRSKADLMPIGAKRPQIGLLA